MNIHSKGTEVAPRKIAPQLENIRTQTNELDEALESARSIRKNNMQGPFLPAVDGIARIAKTAESFYDETSVTLEQNAKTTNVGNRTVESWIHEVEPYQFARGTHSDILKSQLHSAKRLRDKAIDRIHLKDYATAVAFYRKLIRSLEQYPVSTAITTDELCDLKLRLVKLYLLLRRNTDAEHMLDAILCEVETSDIIHYEALMIISRLYAKLGAFRRARQCCQRAIHTAKKIPGSQDDLYFSAVLLLSVICRKGHKYEGERRYQEYHSTPSVPTKPSVLQERSRHLFNPYPVKIIDECQSSSPSTNFISSQPTVPRPSGDTIQLDRLSFLSDGGTSYHHTPITLPSRTLSSEELKFWDQLDDIAATSTFNTSAALRKARTCLGKYLFSPTVTTDLFRHGDIEHTIMEPPFSRGISFQTTVSETHKGCTALYLCATTNPTVLARLLIERGANISTGLV